MRKPYESSERAALVRAVQERGEAVVTAAARLESGVSTAYRWMRAARPARPPTTRSPPAPPFIELVPERDRAVPASLRVLDREDLDDALPDRLAPERLVNRDRLQPR